MATGSDRRRRSLNLLVVWCVGVSTCRGNSPPRTGALGDHASVRSTGPAPVAQGDPTQTPNLLANPGFEEPGAASWVIDNVAGDGPPYVYHLTASGGGHGPAVPRSGDRAIEIYSSNRVTRVSQTVVLAPGTYRLAVWARNNGAAAGPKIELTLGHRTATLPVTSDRYRRYFIDVNITEAGPQLVAFLSKTEGLALDDASLTLVSVGDPPPPYLFVDLFPTTETRSAGTQTYFRGQKQWVNIAFSTVAPQLVTKPVLRLTVPNEVVVSGFNETVLQTWRRPGHEPVLVATALRENGRNYTVYDIQLPRFTAGEDAPVEFGGFWVEVPSGGEALIVADVLNDGRLVSNGDIRLVPVVPPEHPLTPHRLKIVFYDVQDWRMAALERLAALPDQFALMGGNVWSDYGLVREGAPATPSPEDLVRDRAARDHGITDFWPNSEQLFESENDAGATPSLGEYRTGTDGHVEQRQFALRYAAQNGARWIRSIVRTVQRTVMRPRELRLAYRNTGYITDGLEGLPLSYDGPTMTDFAGYAGIPVQDATVEAAQGALREQWLRYNMQLYARAASNLADAIRQVEPGAAVSSTAGSYGPTGVSALPLMDQASWDGHYSFTMPQWYAMNYYGDSYYRDLERGLHNGVYGRGNGHADVIPLWNLSMGCELHDYASLRFKTFDLLSASSVVRGIGYYRGVYAFSDAQTMRHLSELSTLLAEVEDYFVLGHSTHDATFEPDARGVESSSSPKVETSVRVHVLGKAGRLALLTVISHSDHAGGEKGRLRIDLQRLGADPVRDVLFDHLTGQTMTLTSLVEVDTSPTNNLALLEIRRRSP